MNCLYIGTPFEKKIKSGADVINTRNSAFLYTYYDQIDYFFTRDTSQKLNKIATLKNILFYNNFVGVTPKEITKLCSSVKENNYDMCYIANSNLGFLAKIMKQYFPKMKICTFFHNVEFNYFKQLASGKNFYKMPLALCAKKNEEIALQYSDRVIALNQRDADEICRLYDKNVDFILPTSFPDCAEKIECEFSPRISSPSKLLFVGSDFFANEDGIRWFIHNVLPRIDAEVFIVGRGTERWQPIFSANKNVHVLGSVDSLASSYQMADAVVMPIFLGSGMKTKTAEALMYGKNIYATSEALEGYEVEIDKIGAKCNTADEFVNAIQNDLPNRTIYNKFSRQIFLNNYSNDVWYQRFKVFLDDLHNEFKDFKIIKEATE